MNEILIVNIKGLVQVRSSTPTFVAGKEQGVLPVLPDSFLHIKDGLIVNYGSMNDLRDSSLPTIDVTGSFVFPAFVDSHTHMVFGASRET